jgi:protein-tyrosine phosphatase
MIRILMVCLGNICRSPLAEGILRDKITKLGLDAEVHSAGTGNYHINEPADLRSVEVARKNGVDISRHIASQFKQSDFDKYDLIYAMDEENHLNITALARNQSDRTKVKLLMNEALPGENISVPDPYFGGKDGFKNVYRMIDHACSKIAEKLN